MGGLRRVQMGGLGRFVSYKRRIYFYKRLNIYKVYVCVRTTGSVYIASLRLGGRKLPTYELMLRLLGVATMYGCMGGYRNGNVV